MPLNLMIQPQEMSQWCWLAVAATIGDFFAGRPRSHLQCDLAQALVPIPPGTACCSNPTPPPCNKPGPPSIALRHVGHGQAPPFVRYLAPFPRIANEISNGNPVAIAFSQTRTGIAHVVAVPGLMSTTTSRSSESMTQPAALEEPLTTVVRFITISRFRGSRRTSRSHSAAGVTT
jgi:hypothetical protein